MITVVAYAYNAAIHCTACTLRRFRCDESLLDACEDSEGNTTRPIFSTDENSDGYCDTCGHAYGNAEPVAPVLSVEAWRAPEGGWDWNSWRRRCGIVPAAWCDLPPRALLRKLRERYGVPPPGRAAVEDDGYNLVVVERGTREPVLALAYGDAP